MPSSANSNNSAPDGAGARQRSPLVRGLQVLQLLRQQPATVSEVAGILQVNRSSAQRLLGQLEELGYVGRAPGDRRYVLLDRTLDHAEGAGAPSAPAMGDWSQVLDRELRAIRDLVRESALFAVAAPDRMLYASFYPTDHPVVIQESIGTSRPMHASAIGKAYLSALSPSALDIVLGRLNYSEGTSRAAKGPFELRDMLAEVMSRGYATDQDETIIGGSCVATPVFVRRVILVGAAAITGPTHRVAHRLDELGAILVERVQHIETDS